MWLTESLGIEFEEHLLLHKRENIQIVTSERDIFTREGLVASGDHGQ